jgi:hypothetical protein
MKEYATEFIRNIALVSHGGGGKTIAALSHSPPRSSRLSSKSIS